MNSDMLQAGLPPANDRMLTTCFLAAVFHGIIILGVTFNSTNRAAAGPDGPALEVILVNDHAPGTESNPNAPYLAQRSQKGSGNTRSGEPTLVPRSSPAPLDRPGVAAGAGLASLKAGPDPGNDELVASTAPSVRILYFAPPANAAESSEVPALLEDRPQLDMAPNDEGIDLRLRGESKHALWVAADTRESDVAVYLDGWRRKIERVGTMNFPDVARRRKLSGTPVIEVTIGDDGRLLRSVIRRSSGHAQIDEAALRILKLAAPYERFPSALAARHDQIRIAYEWQFMGGGPRDPACPTPNPERSHRLPYCSRMEPRMSDSGYLTNQLLIAMPSMADPNFAQSVALVCDHSARGALGLILNKPLPMRMGEIFDQLEIELERGPLSERHVLRGGPVQTDRGFVVHRAGGEWDSTLKVSDTLHVTTSRDILAAMARGQGPQEAVVALGYAGWDGGQLEDEIRANAWLNAPVESGIIFDLPFESRWQAAGRLLGVELSRISPISGNA